MSTQANGKALLRRLGIQKPIIQAPMAGVSTPALAAAVSNAGALGSLGLGAMNAQAARKAIRDTRELTAQPFNVNLFCHRPATPDAAVERAWLDWLAPVFSAYGATPPQALAEIYTSFVVDEAMQAMLLEERPAVVSFHFGLPPDAVIAALKGAGITLLACATQPDEAAAAVEAGVDALVAQGIEAGGHRGVFDATERDDGLGTLALTRLLVSRFEVPVIAAGGIMDGAGIAAALALGAQAAQLGTAFVACAETAIDAGYRSALLGDAARHTTFTSAISGRVARSLVNRFTALGEQPDAPATPAYPITYDAGKALNAAAKSQGEAGYGAQWAGQAAALARALPAAELVAQLERETRASIAALQSAW
ncbi:NAD(P)H-dependent flavin oxidoreductase [Paraburkholderia acidisoli]|uniref:Nitronate monooxygenase n=1 Tax=Paraburkholderia acidisoli TaxID=2571748 RepID=A0A7Z2GNR9_9BURK|nr:nitronate monooxygenase [Paraburkholderia acidisoli]QGZ64960.1 nitronate monooxygenase [Paraburkholderia acidisoli]